VADALSYQVLEAVLALLRRISVANGFRTDYGAAFAIEDRNVAEVREPIGYLREGDDFQINEIGTSQRQRSGKMLVEIELAIPVSITGAVRLAHNARQDILDALPSSGAPFPDNATGLSVESRRIVTRPEGANFIVVQVTARAGLVERIPPAPEA
jgi:hypothetical protein